jgi:hypothetical protein
MIKPSAISILALGALAGGCATEDATRTSTVMAETKAIEFLKREVPAWSRDNGCFSCHNNGDAARALYAASRKGHRIPAAVLADTSDWVAHPERWDHNQGEPGFSDQRLADVQFTASLAAAMESRQVNNPHVLRAAARRVAQNQADDGSWPVDAANPVGSPATHGTALATYLAWETLRRVPDPEVSRATEKAEAKLLSIEPDCVPNAVVRLMFLANRDGQSVSDERALEFLRRAQTRDGGWGPYADSPPEAFDTALALLALAEFRAESGVIEMIQRGRSFLLATQQSDGSWPATTRPAGGQSYAQQMSTTGWATLALLATK